MEGKEKCQTENQDYVSSFMYRVDRVTMDKENDQGKKGLQRNMSCTELQILRSF